MPAQVRRNDELQHFEHVTEDAGTTKNSDASNSSVTNVGTLAGTTKSNSSITNMGMKADMKNVSINAGEMNAYAKDVVSAED